MMIDDVNEPVRSRILAYQTAHPEQCWYWTYEPPYLAPCRTCEVCRTALPHGEPTPGGLTGVYRMLVASSKRRP